MKRNQILVPVRTNVNPVVASNRGRNAQISASPDQNRTPTDRVDPPRISWWPSAVPGKPDIPIPRQHANVGATTRNANAAVHAITYCCGNQPPEMPPGMMPPFPGMPMPPMPNGLMQPPCCFSIATTISTTSEHVWNVRHDAAIFFTSISGYEYEYWIAAVSGNCHSRRASTAKPLAENSSSPGLRRSQSTPTRATRASQLQAIQRQIEMLEAHLKEISPGKKSTLKRAQSNPSELLKRHTKR